MRVAWQCGPKQEDATVVDGCSRINGDVEHVQVYMEYIIDNFL